MQCHRIPCNTIEYHHNPVCYPRCYIYLRWRFLLVDHSELYMRIPLKCGQNTSPKMVKTLVKTPAPKWSKHIPPKWSNHVRSLDNECCPTSDSLCVLAPRSVQIAKYICPKCKMYLSNFKNSFVQIDKCICPICKLYLSNLMR